jgi:hypothetical protein
MDPTQHGLYFLRAVVFRFVLAGATVCWAQLNDRLGPPLDHPAIQYRSGPVTDPVGVLDMKVRRGDLGLKFDGPQGYLRALLESLHIPIESQIAVFSRTSLQASSNLPRTIRSEA